MDFLTTFCSIVDGEHYFVSVLSNMNTFLLAITSIGSDDYNMWSGVSSDITAAIDRSSMKTNSFW